MAAQQPANYKVFCIVVDKTPFSVKISPHETVDELKDAIKVKQSPGFDKFVASDLDLYLINLANDGSLIEKVGKLLAGHPPPPPLEPIEELSAVFLKPPVKGIVHILVQPPSPSEFLHADLRRIARLTKPSHVVGLGDSAPPDQAKRKASEMEKEMPNSGELTCIR
jgi:Crinkler effector protein N-terminal domain